MKFEVFKATTLPDAWFQLIYALMKGDNKNVYIIESGSYVGQKRLEFPFVVVQIDQPMVRPLIPDIPPQLTIPPPVDGMDYVEEYFSRYLMSTEVAQGETYTYGTWLAPGVERVISQFRKGAGTNQATISIGGWAPQNDAKLLLNGHTITISHDTDNYIDPVTNQKDPACLRVVDFRLENNKLHMFVYFRSWDLWGGFPANLAGLQLVKEYICEALGVQDGRILAASKGLHIYDYAVQMAATRIGMKNVGSMDDFLKWVENGNF